MTPRLALAISLALSCALACNGRDQPKLEEGDRRPRAVDPPTAKEVRALPPHVIRADGVGPFKVGASLSEQNDLLPSGPHIAQIDIPNMLHVSVLRAEDDGILIGGEPQGRAAFVAVVGGQVARTASGIHVGSTRAELVSQLGAPEQDADRVRDPRIVVPGQMPELRAVMVGDRVAGLVVTAREPAHEALHEPAGSAGSDAASVDGDEVTLRGSDDKVIWSRRVPGIAFAALIHAADHEELYEVTHADDSSVRTWSVAGFRIEAGKLVSIVDPTPVYQLTAANARWIGAELGDVNLLLEIASRPDGIEVGGLLTTRVGDKLRDLLVLAPVQVAHKRARPPVVEPSNAGTPDAP